MSYGAGSNVVKAKTQSLGSRRNLGAIHSGRSTMNDRAGSEPSPRTTHPRRGTGAITSGKGGRSQPRIMPSGGRNPMRSAMGRGRRNDHDADDY